MSKENHSSLKFHIYPSKEKKQKKTILLFHGWGSSVKKYEAFANVLASEGFRVILPEIMFHDSRNKLENHYTIEATQEFFWKTIFTSVDETEERLTELETSPEEIILLGISMGGFIASGIYAKDNRYAGLININGSGSFLLTDSIFRQYDNRSTPTTVTPQQLSEYDPIKEEAPTSPMLLVHGEKDRIVSIKGQENYFNHFKPKTENDILTFMRYKDIDHTVSSKMMADILQWLRKHFGH